jgi:hypothetical protein
VSSATAAASSPLGRVIGATLSGALVVFGLLTCLPGVLAISPELGNRLLFGNQLELTASTDLIVRHWGATIFLVGAAMVVAAVRPDVRGPVLAFALAEKVVLVVLVAAAQAQPWGRAYLMPGVLDAIISTWIVLVLVTGNVRARS